MNTYTTFLSDFRKNDCDKCTQIFAYSRVLLLYFHMLFTVLFIGDKSAVTFHDRPLSQFSTTFCVLQSSKQNCLLSAGVPCRRIDSHRTLPFFISSYQTYSFCHSIIILDSCLRFNTESQSVAKITPTISALAVAPVLPPLLQQQSAVYLADSTASSFVLFYSGRVRHLINIFNAPSVSHPPDQA